MEQPYNMDNEPDYIPISRAEGNTEAEKYLKSLCEKSFLTLWGYSSVHRNTKSSTGKGGNEENGDYLVVFENHILIFEDKNCKFKDSGDLKLDWSRWYKDSILEAARQIKRDEGWIRNNPNRLFVDKACNQPLPIPIPDLANAKFHRIIVAHGSSERCKKVFGGSGSMMISVDNVGTITNEVSQGKVPFTVGHIDASKGFIHIFDDVTLPIVLQALDTISDFVAYLTKKEELFCSMPFLRVSGEEELLAHYLKNMNAHNEHDFMFPADIKGVGIEEGLWEEFCQNPQRIAQLKRNEISYAWDEMLEKFIGHTLAGTQHHSPHSVEEIENVYRFLARENRTRRYMLADNFFGLMNKTAPNERGVRVMEPFFPGDPYYIFMLFPQFEGISEEEYRIARRNHLEQYCIAVKATYPDAQDIVGIAINSDTTNGVSEDLMYMDAREWSNEAQEEAMRLKQEYNLLVNVNRREERIQEYPDVPMQPKRPRRYTQPNGRTNSNGKKVYPNDQCLCGSGVKYKKCCGKR